MEKGEGGIWDYTIRASKDLLMKPGYEPPSREAPYGKFFGRPMTGRDFRINGSVDVGPGKEAAVVIDDQKQAELREAYKLLLNRTGSRISLRYLDEKKALIDVLGVSRELIPYDEKYTKKIDKKYTDQKIELAMYIGKGGVCRQQGLLAGYLIEKLIADRHLDGKVSIERNWKKGKGGHQWVRYI